MSDSEVTDALEPAEGCPTCKRLQVWARSAWARGHAMGMAANERTAREATEALRREKEAHSETNWRLTESLLEAEEQRDALQAALIEAMRQVAKIDPSGAAEWLRQNTTRADQP